MMPCFRLEGKAPVERERLKSSTFCTVKWWSEWPMELRRGCTLREKINLIVRVPSTLKFEIFLAINISKRLSSTKRSEASNSTFCRDGHKSAESERFLSSKGEFLRRASDDKLNFVLSPISAV